MFLQIYPAAPSASVIQGSQGMMGRISKQGMGVPEMWESRPAKGVKMPLDAKDTEIHELRNSLLSLAFALEEITIQKQAERCKDIALRALATLKVGAKVAGK